MSHDTLQRRRSVWATALLLLVATVLLVSPLAAAGTAPGATSGVQPALGTGDSVAAVGNDAVALDTDWGNAGGDPGRSGHNPNSSGPKTNPDARWIHEFTDDANDQPAVVADGLVFVPGDESVRAVDNDSGEEVWNVTGLNVESVSTAEGVVVVTEVHYSGDSIRAFHASNGTEIWNETGFEADASVALDGAFFATRGEYLYAFDLHAGGERWSVDLNEDVSRSLSASDDTLYATGQVNPRDYAVYAMNATDGSERWRFEVEGAISMAPVVDNGSVFVGGGGETDGVTYDPKFYRLNTTDGHVEWIFDSNARPQGAAVADGFVYVASGNSVHALDETTGERQWLHRLSGSLDYGLNYKGMNARPPVVADGTVYAVNDRGHLVALDGASGTQLWRYLLEGWATPPAVVDDRVYVHVIDTENFDTDYSRVYALEDPPFRFSAVAPSTTSVEPGEQFTVDVTVENVDAEPREYNLSLMADPPMPMDPRAIDRATGTLNSGGSTTITFSGVFNTSGAWNLSVQRPLERGPAVDPATVAVDLPTEVDDWPHVGFDSGRTKWNPDTAGPKQYAQEVWNLGSFDDDVRPVIANGTVFAVHEHDRYSGSSDIYTLTAYEEATGAEEWAFNVSAYDRIPAGSPTVAGDTVYLFGRPWNFDGEGPAVNDNSVFALNVTDGSLEWSRSFTLNSSISQVDRAPIVADGQVYVAGGTPERTFGDNNASLIALDADSGDINWRYTVKAHRENELFYSVAAADGMVVATLADEDADGSGGSVYDDRLVALNSAGGHAWSTSGSTVDVLEPPVVRDGAVYFVAETHQQDGDPVEELRAVNLSDGGERWTFSPTYRDDEANGWRLASPIVTDDAVYVSQWVDLTYDTSEFYRLDRANGDVVWNRSVPHLGAAFAVDGLLYAGSADGDDTLVYDAATGEKYTETDFFSRGRGAVQVVANGTMITYADSTTPYDFRVIRGGGAIEYTDLSVDTARVDVDENVTVTATATNFGAYAREYDVTLMVAPDDHNTNHYVWSGSNREGSLAPGESATVTWEVELRERGDVVFTLLPVNDGDGSDDDGYIDLNLHMFDSAGSATVNVGDAEDGTVVDLGGPRALAPDTDAWPTESFDAGNTGNYTGTGAPTAVGGDVVTWLANHSYEWESGPIVVDDTAFAGGYDGGDDSVYAYDATDGSLRWEYPTTGDVDVTPTYAGGYLYTATSRDRVYQFDAATGERLWTFDAGGDVGGITVVDDVAYVTADYSLYFDGETTSEDRLYALNATTREILWTFAKSSSGYGFSDMPAVDDGTVYVVHDGEATYALDAATGAEAWSRPIASSGTSLHSPVVEDGVVYVDDGAWDSTDAHLYALDATDGTTIWNVPANVDGYTGSSPALADDTLYFTADGALRAIDATTGQTGGDRRWSNQICAAARYSPVHADGTIFVPMADSTFRAYDADTGDLVWRYDGYDDYSFTPAVVDGLLYTTGLENVDDVYSLVALSGGTTDQPKSMVEFSGLDVSPTDATTGQTVTASATVENLADTDCGYEADFEIDDTVVDNTSGTLGTTWSTYDDTVEFTHTFSATGAYNVSIAGLPPVEVTVTQPQPEIEVTPSSYEFADRDVGINYWEAETQTFVISNVGQADLDWTSTALTGSDAGSFDLSYTGGAVLAPGTSDSVDVYFTPETEGSLSATLEFESNDPTDATVEVPLSGTGVVDPPVVNVTPSSVDFGEVQTGTTTTETLTVTNDGGSPLTFENVTIDSSDAISVVFGNSTTTIETWGAHQVFVEYAPTAANVDAVTLRINTDDPENGTVSVPITGTAAEPAPEVSVAPSTLEFGEVENGTSESAAVTVTNVGDAPLTVDDVAVAASDRGFFSVASDATPFVLAPGESRDATVAFAPTAFESDSGTLAIATNDTATPTATVALSGTGVEPPGEISVSTSSLKFGDVDVDENATRTVTVENVGGGNLSVDAPSVGGTTTFSVTAGDEAVDLEPGETHEIDVTFAPNAIGAQSGTLQLASDDPENSLVSVDLDGSGYLDPGVYYGYDVASTTVSEDQNVSVTVSVFNHRAVDDEFDATITVDGTPVLRWNGTAQPDERVRDTFGLSLAPGDYDVAVNDVESTTVTVTAVPKPDVSVTPDEIDFGEVAVDDNATATVTVSNDGYAALTFEHARVSGSDDYTVTAGNATTTVAAGDSHDLTIRFEPTAVGAANATLGVLTNDPDELTVIVSLTGNGTITVPNRPPVAANDHFTVYEGEWLNVSWPGVLANDFDPNNDSFSSTYHGNPDNGSLAWFYGSGGFNYSADPGFTGTDSFHYWLQDDEGASSSHGTVSIEVLPDPNRPPEAIDDHYSVHAGEWLNVSWPGVLANDRDPDGNDFSSTYHGNPDDGTLAWFYGSGGFNYIPDSSFVGTDSFNYWVRDEHGEHSGTGTVTIDVLPPRNRAPTAVPDTFTVVEGEWLNVSWPGVLANDYDVDGDTITASHYGNPDDGSLAWFYGSGGFNYSADPGFTGTDSFIYQVRDEQGEYSGFVTVTIEVVPDPNRAPETVDDHYSVHAGEWLNVSWPGVLANDYDVDNDTFSSNYHGTPDNGSLAWFYGSGGFNYTPNSGFTGTDSFNYWVRDEHGEHSGTGTVTIDVIDPAGTRPVAVDDHYTVVEGEWLNVSWPGVLANDYDPNNDSFSSNYHGNPDNGSLAWFYGSGGFNYTPNSGFTGTDSFNYWVRDEHGEQSGAGTVTIEVVPDPDATGNRAPTTVEDTYTVYEGEWLNVSWPGVLSNDYDVDGDDFSSTYHGNPDDGTLAWFYGSGGFNYSADPGFTGTDSFNYWVRDEHGEHSGSGTVTIEVLPDPNRPPEAIDDHYSVHAGERLNVSWPGVLANDRDPDGDDFSSTYHGNPDDGSLAWFYGSGGFNYTPDSGFVGTDSFNYWVRDEHGEHSGTGTVTIDVLPPRNRAPTAVPDDYVVVQGETLSVSAPGVSANDHDVDDDAFSATYHGNPDNGTLDPFYGSGGFEYTPDPEFTGVDSFVYWVEDEHDEGAGYATVRITVVEASTGNYSDVAIARDGVDFGHVPAGTTVTETLTVANVGDLNLTVAGATLSGPDALDFTVTGGNATTVLGYGGTTAIAVEYAPTGLGPADATLTIHTDDPDEQAVAVSFTAETYDFDAPTVHAVDVTGSYVDDSGSNGSIVYENETVGIEVDAADEFGSVRDVRVTLDSRTTADVSSRLASRDSSTGNWTTTIDVDSLADGRYDVIVKAYDGRGNRRTVVADDSVVVDHGPPNLAASVTRLNETAANVTVNADEALRPGTLTVDVELPNGVVEPVNMVDEGDHWNGTVELAGDGQYVLTATALNLVGQRGTDDATAQFVTESTKNNTITVQMQPSGLFVRFNTDRSVNDTYVTMTESKVPVAPLVRGQSGVNFLDAVLGKRLTENLTYATLGIPVDQSLLRSGADVDDVTIRYFNETRRQWTKVPTRIENVTLNGTTDRYWVATVTHFSTYGAVAADTTPPSVTATEPLDGYEFPAGTSSTTIRVEYGDALSGVDPGETVVVFDDALVTTDPATTVTEGFVEFEATELADNSSHTLDVAVADGAGNRVVETLTFSVAGAASSGGDGDENGDESEEDDTPPEDDTPDVSPVTVTAIADGGFEIRLRSAGGDRPLTARFPAGAVGAAGVTLEALDLALVGEIDATLGVAASASPPPGTPQFSSADEPLAYLNVSHPTLADDDVTNATFRFGIDRETLVDRGTDPDDVALHRYHDGAWTALPTSLANETDAVMVFEAAAPGLSAFAVSAPAAQSTPTATPEPTPTATEPPTAGRTTEVPTTTRTTGTPTVRPTGTPAVTAGGPTTAVDGTATVSETEVGEPTASVPLAVLLIVVMAVLLAVAWLRIRRGRPG